MSALLPFVRTLGVALGLGLLAPLPTASAYVHTLTPSGCNPIHWAQSCVFVTTDTRGVADLPGTDVERIVQSAIGGWSTKGSFLSLEYVPATEPRDVGVDGWQTITFRHDTWCRPGTGTEPATCYDPLANAVTTITYVHDAESPENDGRITDADIELNAVNAHFYDADAQTAAPPDGARRVVDLWNTLSHELGHLQGLDHTCRSASDSMPRCARDHLQQPVVACADVEAHHADDAELGASYASTMYPSSRPRETHKRAPEPDDHAAVVALYASKDDPTVCALPTAGAQTQSTESPGGNTSLPSQTMGCSAGPRGAASVAHLGYVALGLFGLAHARRRRRPVTSTAGVRA